MGKGADKEGIVLGLGKEGEEFRLLGGGELGEGLNSFCTSISVPCCCC
jgi:hypothetical protein